MDGMEMMILLWMMMKVMMPYPPMIQVATWMRSLLDLPSDLFWDGVLVFLVTYVLGTQIHLREVKVFDEVVAGRMCGRYGRVSPVKTSAKPSRTCLLILLSPRCIIKCLNDFYHVKIP
jgi:hypothetical protein